MKILLDTQVLYWWVVSPERLGGRATQLIADIENIVYVSTMSWFELLQKQRVGKLSDKLDILRELNDESFTVCSISQAALMQYRDLPALSWRDPIDHILMAQAMAEQARLITADGHILSAKINGLRLQNAKK